MHDSDEFIARLVHSANAADRCGMLVALGCFLIRCRRPTPTLPVPAEENTYGEVQSDWIDGQLYDCLPYQAELATLDDARMSAMQSAWPDGFQWVVFNEGHDDEAHAKDLVEPYLEWLERLTLPDPLEFWDSPADFEKHLIESFAQMIRAWRVNVIIRLEQHGTS